MKKKTIRIVSLIISTLILLLLALSSITASFSILYQNGIWYRSTNVQNIILSAVITAWIIISPALVCCHIKCVRKLFKVCIDADRVGVIIIISSIFVLISVIIANFLLKQDNFRLNMMLSKIMLFISMPSVLALAINPLLVKRRIKTYIAIGTLFSVITTVSAIFMNSFLYFVYFASSYNFEVPFIHIIDMIKQDFVEKGTIIDYKYHILFILSMIIFALPLIADTIKRKRRKEK